MNTSTRKQQRRPRHTAAMPRVAAAGRIDAAVAPGGGEVQMTATAEALGRLGVQVTPVRHDQDAQREDALRDDWLDDVDVLHLFGSRPEHGPLLEAARRRGVPTALSTIAWFDLASYWHGSRSATARVAAAARFAARAVCPSLPSWRRRLYHDVDLLLPNSQAEAEQLIRYFGVAPERIHIVPNGADDRFAHATPELFERRFGRRGFVLSVGRIEPRKNQLALIRSLRGSGVPLVVIGRVVPGHDDYLAACQAQAGPETVFLGHLEHDDPLLASAYAACGCLALVSRFETPGLVALEAGMLGTPLVLPRVGAAREYFGPHAQYVGAGSLREIRGAVLRALAQGRSPELARHVREQFTWTATAQATLEAYRRIA